MKKLKTKYFPDADILSIEVSPQTIDHAHQAGNLIIHYSAKNEVVLLEVLDVTQSIKAIDPSSAQTISSRLKN